MSYADQVGFQLPFIHELADRDQWIEIRDRTAGGTRPVIIVLDSTRPGVHFGFLSLSFNEEFDVVDLFRVTVGFKELPFVERLGT